MAEVERTGIDVKGIASYKRDKLQQVLKTFKAIPDRVDKVDTVDKENQLPILPTGSQTPLLAPDDRDDDFEYSDPNDDSSVLLELSSV